MKPPIFEPAVFDGRYRYWLDRDLGSGNETYVWIGKNPSKANDVRNDSSVSRVMRRAKEKGFGKLVVVNLYAYVSPDPRRLLDSFLDARGPIGPRNLDYIDKALQEADCVLLGWGAAYIGPKHEANVLGMVREAGKPTYCLGLTMKGSPVHPGRMSTDTQTVPFWKLMKISS